MKRWISLAKIFTRHPALEARALRIIKVTFTEVS